MVFNSHETVGLFCLAQPANHRNSHMCSMQCLHTYMYLYIHIYSYILYFIFYMSYFTLYIYIYSFNSQKSTSTRPSSRDKRWTGGLSAVSPLRREMFSSAGRAGPLRKATEIHESQANANVTYMVHQMDLVQLTHHWHQRHRLLCPIRLPITYLHSYPYLGFVTSCRKPECVMKINSQPYMVACTSHRYVLYIHIRIYIMY